MKHLLLGSLSGIVIGGIYGLINTPRSGRENQEMLKAYIDETTYHVQDVNDKVNDLKFAVSQLTAESKFVQEEFMSDIQKIASDFQYEAEPRIRRIQEKAEKIQKEVEETTQTVSNTV